LGEDRETTRDIDLLLRRIDAEVARRAEADAATPTDEQGVRSFVAAAYRSVLGREPDAASLERFVELDRRGRYSSLEVAGELSRRLVARELGPNAGRGGAEGSHTAQASGTGDAATDAGTGAARGPGPVALEELLGYEGGDFVVRAYHALLGREPDPHGYDFFVDALRSGRVTKGQVLWRLSSSAEGRRAGVRVQGLIPHRLAERLRRIPLVGRALAGGVALLDLPAALERMRARSIELARRSNQLAARLDDEVEVSRNQLVERVQILSTSLMASVEEERSARSELVALLEREIVARGRSETALAAGRSGPGARGREELPPGFDALYLAFEETFRGSSEEIKQRLEVYLDPLERAGAGTADRPVLDLGCGRGELIDMLTERGWRASGIDLNPEVVRRCRERGLQVEEGEALTHLRVLPSASLGAVVGLHLLEHLGLGTIIELLGEAYRVLRPGGIAILETPNPENVVVGSTNFWLDPTHERPLHPLALKFLAGSRGFDPVEVLRLNPVPHDEQVTDDEESAIVRRFNKYFFGARDFAIVGHKR